MTAFTGISTQANIRSGDLRIKSEQMVVGYRIPADSWNELGVTGQNFIFWQIIIEIQKKLHVMGCGFLTSSPPKE